MRSLSGLFVVVLALTLAAPNFARSESLSTPSGGEKVAAEGIEKGGPGQGFQPEAEIAKGEEVPATFGPIVTDTAIPIEKGHFAVQPTFGFSFKTDSFTGNWKRGSTGGDYQSFSNDWKIAYGPIENMEVFVVIPVAYNWARNVDEPSPDVKRSASSGGLGDLNLTMKYRVVEETKCLPTITALFAVDFPTGKFKNLNANDLETDEIGSGSYVFTPGINFSKYIKPFIVYANLWYSMSTDHTGDDGKKHPRDTVTINLAAEYPITEKWVALMELTSSWGAGRLFGPKANTDQEDLLSVVPGIEYMATDKFAMAFGINFDLIGRNEDATIGPLFSMVYSF